VHVLEGEAAVVTVDGATLGIAGTKGFVGGFAGACGSDFGEPEMKDTLGAERLEIYPFLGSYLLGEAIDAVGADLAVHGHAHNGSEKGITPGGVPVRNVALPVIKTAYALYCLD
jgi:hypothetical protein